AAALFQAETVERSDFEMFAQGELGCFGREHPIIVTDQDRIIILEEVAQGRGFAGINDFRRPKTLQLREQRGFGLELGDFEIPSREIDDREAVALAEWIDRCEKIVPFRRKHPFVEM